MLCLASNSMQSSTWCPVSDFTGWALGGGLPGFAAGNPITDYSTLCRKPHFSKLQSPHFWNGEVTVFTAHGFWDYYLGNYMTSSGHSPNSASNPSQWRTENDSWPSTFSWLDSEDFRCSIPPGTRTSPPPDPPSPNYPQVNWLQLDLCSKWKLSLNSHDSSLPVPVSNRIPPLDTGVQSEH